jgi:hypothetical protein
MIHAVTAFNHTLPKDFENIAASYWTVGTQANYGDAFIRIYNAPSYGGYLYRIDQQFLGYYRLYCGSPNGFKSFNEAREDAIALIDQVNAYHEAVVDHCRAPEWLAPVLNERGFIKKPDTDKRVFLWYAMNVSVIGGYGIERSLKFSEYRGRDIFIDLPFAHIKIRGKAIKVNEWISDQVYFFYGKTYRLKGRLLDDLSDCLPF